MNVVNISDRSTVESRVAGALKNTVDAHGPIDKDWVASAAKRIYGMLKGLAKEQRCLEFHAVWHYAKHDKEFDGDYYLVELFRDGKLVTVFGDWYHDKGHVKLRSFLDGIEYITGNKVVYTKEEIADGKT